MSEGAMPIDGQRSEPVVMPDAGVAAAALARIQELVTSAEEGSRKANSEAGFAFNAKQVAEEHAAAITRIKGNAEAEATWLSTTRQSVEADTQSISARKQEADGATKAVLAAKADCDAKAAQIAAAADSGQKALEAIQSAQTEVAGFRQRVADTAAEIAQAKVTSEGYASAAQTARTQVGELLSQAKTDGAAVTESKNEAAAVVARMAEVNQTAGEAQARVSDYEMRLGQLQTAFEELRGKIETLLPGATSAGLASAFQDQKARFVWPQRIWLGVFIATAIILALVGWSHLREVNASAAGGQITWDLVLRHITNRLLLVGPLVWLALVAGRNYSTAQRVQEDYAYKEAMSRSFEGYKREMAGLPQTNAELVPLIRLCEGVLATLAQRPGRLYEGKHDDITPLTPASKAAAELLAQVKSLLKKPDGNP